MMKKNNIKINKTLKSVLIFVLVMIVCYFGGMMAGNLIRKVRDSGFNFNIDIKNICEFFIYAMPYLIIALMIIAGCICFVYYLKSKKAFIVWNGEDEDIIERVEYMLSKCMLVSNVALIIDYFFIGVWIYLCENVEVPEKILGINSFIVVVFFFSSLILFIVIQRLVVELEKKINPEKKGEVLDFKFQKEWEKSFDEAEKSIAYKAGYKSFKFTSYTCLALWLVAIFVQIMFNTGILPLLFISVVWLVSTVTYQLEAMKLENKR